MNSKEVKHNKHAALIRPALGNFGRNEWAILGAPCTDIKLLAEQLTAALSPTTKIAYVDAQHSNELATASPRLTAGAFLEYTEKDRQWDINLNGSPNNFQNRSLFNPTDLILINGNHHQGEKQVVIIDSRKEASLQKRLAQLTDVRLFLLAGDAITPFGFIKEAIPGWEQIPVYHLDETEPIIDFFKATLAKNKPELYGLVLAGGKSERMGQDKGTITWHQQQQRYYMANLLKNYTENVFISCRADQQQEIDAAYPTLTDTFTDLGPFGAILSAFREQPEKAWLVVACDLPLLDKPTLAFLTAHRDTSTIATAFQNPVSGFPEPLITIWEPKSYAVLLSFLSQGYSCPRKVLINSDTNVLQAPDTDALTNVNTPKDKELVNAMLQEKNINA